jgi:hypothetical protein
VLWIMYFLEAQGYKIDDNVLYQDNNSSILLETNGRGSSGKRTRHIAVQYFFIADRVKSKEVQIEYCPTGIMIADYFTKPLQGAIFRELRDMIMGNTVIALPEATDSKTEDQLNVIQIEPTQSESRSVLKNEIVSESSPRSPVVLPARAAQSSISLTVLHAYGSRKKCLDTKTQLSKPVVSKPTLTWAEIASK